MNNQELIDRVIASKRATLVIDGAEIVHRDELIEALSAPTSEEVRAVICDLEEAATFYINRSPVATGEEIGLANKCQTGINLIKRLARDNEWKQSINDEQEQRIEELDIECAVWQEYLDRAEKAERQLEEYKADAEAYRELIKFMQQSIAKDERITDGKKPTAAEMFKIIGGARIRGME